MKREALKHALDIRKFEIELYWKRATYFWGFLIVIFGGYFAVLGSSVDSVLKHKIQLIISCIGIVFSIGWFLVNKGSKYWQNNWERHVDRLENDVMGPLYKSYLVQKKGKKLDFIVESSNYSVSKINQILSFYLVLVWSLITFINLTTVINDYWISINVLCVIPDAIYDLPILSVGIFFITVIFLILIIKQGKSRNYKNSYTEESEEHFSFRDE
ncbi:RipA family octameric membrane protein [Salimicrobium humidisoli]|uniref:Uncharacterized protein n=1 Tax=Salimicrobium humidisoli TaxID=2029857 RepID=A0ABX4HQU9_9BACI|nr:hypothetical protein [Salimicrobium humidisoli]PBB05602.1 hypothetical protein CKW00_08455 [Salimicrobium humidisoli]